MSKDNPDPCLYVFSGAGLSAESGIATFRTGDDAIWDNHTVEEVCYLPNFIQNYELVHDFYNARRAEVKAVKPNAAHLQIAKWEQEFGSNRVFNITTNIDTLLQAAGCTNVHHVHGRADQLIRNYNPETEQGSHIQSCGLDKVHYDMYMRKGELVKPNVVFFGESQLHTEDGVEPLYETAYDMLDKLKPSDTIIVVGASFQVVPIHILLIGKPLFTINVNPFYDDDASAKDMSNFFDHQVREPATTGLASLDVIVQDRMADE